MVSMDDMDTHPSTLSRRTLVAGAAWGVPAVMVVGAAPAMAASRHNSFVKYPTSATPTNQWTGLTGTTNLSDNPPNAYASAVMGNTHKNETWTFTANGFGFNLEPSATNISVTIDVRYRMSNTQANTLTVTASGPAGVIPTPVTTGFQVASETHTTYTRTQVNDINFTVAAYHVGGSSDPVTFDVDYITVTVDYDY